MNQVLVREGEGLIVPHFEGRIVMGADATVLPHSLQERYAEQVAIKLAESPWTKPQSADHLLWTIRDARAVLCVHPESFDLLAFGKIELFPKPIMGGTIHEFGSWASFVGNGYGKQVLAGARDLAAQKYPYDRLIAVVRAENHKAQMIMEEIGGNKVAYLNPGGRHVYDITKRQPITHVVNNMNLVWTIEPNRGAVGTRS